MTKHTSTHAHAAKMIRQKLKRNGISARVRSSSYAGGNSVDVTITEDVLPATRDKIEQFAKQFQYGHFDGMTDSYNYSNKQDDIPQVRFVFVSIEYSKEIQTDARNYVASCGIEEHKVTHYAYMALSGSWGDFWTARKPRKSASF